MSATRRRGDAIADLLNLLADNCVERDFAMGCDALRGLGVSDGEMAEQFAFDNEAVPSARGVER